MEPVTPQSKKKILYRIVVKCCRGTLYAGQRQIEMFNNIYLKLTKCDTSIGDAAEGLAVVAGVLAAL
jgi:hypothetical protein